MEASHLQIYPPPAGEHDVPDAVLARLPPGNVGQIPGLKGPRNALRLGASIAGPWLSGLGDTERSFWCAFYPSQAEPNCAISSAPCASARSSLVTERNELVSGGRALQSL
jgi:hypothetical protein